MSRLRQFALSIREWLTSQSKTEKPRTLDVSVLEDRILYSATPLPIEGLSAPDTAAEILEPADIEAQWDMLENLVSSELDLMQQPIESPLEQDLLDSAPPDSSTTQPTRFEVMFVDSSVEGHEFLVTELQNQVFNGTYLQVVLIDSDRDGLEQVTQWLSQSEQPLDAIHFLSHGTSGSFQLGSTRIEQSLVAERQDEFSAWRQWLNDEADLLIYGCDLASNDDGKLLLTSLQELIGADIAGSEDLTGHADLGGNWVLEFSIGQIDSELVVSTDVMANWHGLLDLTAVGNETLVNGSTASNQLFTADTGQQLAMDASGRFVVTWYDNRSGNNDVYARVYNADGTARTGEFMVHAANASAQDWSNVAMADNGNFVMTWSDNRSGTYEVYMRLFNVDGTALTGETVVSALSGAQDYHSVDFASDGSFVVVFQNASDTNIYFQRYNSSGTAQGSNTVVNNLSSGTQNHADIVVRDDGSFIVTWSDNTNEGNGTGIFARMFNSSGTALANQFQVNTFTMGNQYYSSVDADSNGSFVISWTSANQDGSGEGVYMKRYNSSGSALTGDILVNTITSNEQRFSHVDMNAEGDFIVAWEDNANDSGGAGIFAQQFDRNGTRIGGQIVVNATSTGSQTTPSVAFHGSSAVVAWMGNGPGDTNGIFFQRYTTTNYSTLTVTTTSNTADGDTSSIAALLANRGFDGQISLREAILATNNSTNGVGGADRIFFSISTGAQTINVTGSNLADITQALIIDGSTQPGYSGAPLISLVDGDTRTHGLVLAGGSSGSTIRGLNIRGFNTSGINILSSNNTIAGNYIGTNAAGNAAAANFQGIVMTGGDNNVIGGTGANDRNVISGNTQDGIAISAAANNTQILGNYIGLNAAGTSALGNSWSGVSIFDSSGTVIGDGTTAGRNVISGNGHRGIYLSNADDTVIQGNYIGTNAAGNADVNGTSSNGLQSGILVRDGSTNVTIGGYLAGQGNVISGNNWYGVEFIGAGTSNNLMVGNIVGLNAAGTAALGNSGGGVSFFNSASNNLLGGGQAGARNIISGNLDVGVYTANNNPTGNKIQGNFIGLAANGSTVFGNANHGILIVDGATNNIIGTDNDGINDATEGNVISGNVNGVVITGVGVTGNVVAGNWIGTDATGTLDRGNTIDGVRIEGGATSNTVGGTDANQRNVISGNNARGIVIQGSGTNSNIVRSNYVGTNAAGTAAIGNTGSGIAVWDGAQSNTIGGSTAGAGNLISGNGNDGITISDTGTNGTTIQGNLIGVNATATAKIGNMAQGIWVGSGVQSTVIGGTGAGAGNIIGGNTFAGIELNGANTSGNFVYGNFIGTNTTGLLDLGNSIDGILVVNGANNNSIGGTISGAGNTIAFNGRDGVRIESSAGSGNAILGNRIYSNAGLGINLVGGSQNSFGVTANDLGDGDSGASGLQNFPVFSSVTIDGTNIAVAGTLNSTANRTFRVDVFGNTAADASGYGQGQRYLGTFNVTTDGSGNVAFNETLAGVTLAAGEYVAYTATDLTTNNTSEFSYAVMATLLVNTAPSALAVTGTRQGGLTINQNGGNDAYLIANDGGAVFGGLTQMTIETQLSFTTPGLDMTLLSYGAHPSNLGNDVNIRLMSDGTLRFYINGAFATANTFDYSSLADGQAHTLSITWNNTAGAWQVFVDGVLRDSGNGLRVGATVQAGGELIIGNDTDTIGVVNDSNQKFSGTFHDLRIFNHVRTSQQVAAAYQSDLPYWESGLLANWRFNGISANQVITEVVSGNNLSLQQATGAGFVADDPSLTLSVTENAITGTVVGSVSGVDLDREARITQLLAADPNLRYSAETGSFYKLVNSSVNWTTALSAATSNTLAGVAGNLVVIDSATENKVIHSMAAAHGGDVWIGASDSVVEGEWRWYNGGTAGDLFWRGATAGYVANGEYQNWVSTEPSAGQADEDFGRLRHTDGLWLDTLSGSTFRYVVEWNADDVLDASNALTYSIQSQTVAGAFTIDASTGRITVADGNLLDYETNATHTLTFRVTDGDGNSYDETFTISLNDLAESNNAPTNLSSGIELNTDGGNGSFLAIDGSTLLGNADKFTLEVSFAIASLPSSQIPLIDFSNGSEGNDIRIAIGVDGRIVFSVRGSDVTTSDAYLHLLDGQKYSVATSWDNSSGSYAIYIDGRLVETGSGLTPPLSLLSSHNITLGGDRDDAGDVYLDTVFHGALYDVRVWNEVRSEAEIALNYQHKFDSGSLPGGLVANWQMDGFNGSNQVVDVVSGNNLSIGHAGAGFIASTPRDDLHITENSAPGTSVGFVVPSDPDVSNDVVRDGLFTEAADPAMFATFTSGQSIGNWTVAGADDVYLHNADGVYQDETPLGGNTIHLRAGLDSAVAQTLSTEIGRQYQIVFAGSGLWDAAGVKQLRVSAGGQSADFIYGQAPSNWNFANSIVWEHHSLTFTATDTSTTLRFEDNSGYVGQGTLLADIRVIEIPAAVTTILNNDPTLSYDAATNKFYRFVSTITQPLDAINAATASTLNGVNGQLATIRSAYENELIRAFAQQVQGDVLLGGRDATTEGNWRFLDGATESEQFSTGSTAQNGYYTSWSPSEPNGSTSENHLAIRPDGLWQDVPDDQSRAYVIEWDASEVLSNFTFSLTDDAGGRFAIDSNSGEIIVANGSLIDYETATSHSVTVQVTDAAGNSYSEVMSIAVGNGLDVNQTIPLSTQNINEDGSLVFSSGNGNAVTVSDSLGSTNTPMQVFLSVNNGTLTLSQSTGLSIPGGANGSSFMTIQGTESAINAALEGLIYTPTVNYNGSDTLVVTTSMGADLQGHYTFEGGNAIDQSVGTSQNGTFVGNATTVIDPQRGEVLSLDGVDDGVQISGLFGNPSHVTLAAWINATALDSNGGEVISMGDSVILRVTSGGHLHGLIYNGSDWIHVAFAPGYSLAGTGWHHVAFTFDDAGNSMRLFLDGNEVATAATAASISYTQGANSFVGRHANGGTTWDFNGLIDDARIYTRALTADEIAALAADQTSVTSNVAITVNAVNDAPTNSGTLPATLTVTEDVLSNLDLSAIDLSDVDHNGGLLTLSLSSDAGGNFYATSSGGVTVDLSGTDYITLTGTLADLNAYLNVTTNIQYLHPTANLNGTAADIVYVSINDNGNTGSGGAIDTILGNVQIDITPVNDAPVLDNSGNMTLTSINEDQLTNSGNTVASIIASASGNRITDVDSGAVEGIAITATTNGNGSWQFSTDGGVTWQGVGAVSNNYALMLRDSDLVRFVPNGDAGTTGEITFRAWDQTSGLAGGYANTSTNGGSSAFSTATETASITVSDVNDGPTFDLGTGRNVLNLSGSQTGNAIAQQADGKYLLTGWTDQNGTRDFIVARYNANGTLDTSFGAGAGYVVTAIGSADDEAQSIRVLSDGKILVVGHSFGSNNWDITLVRYNADGSLDTSFGSGSGMVVSNYAGEDKGFAFEIQSDGKILVAGGNGSDFQLTRFNANGTLDTTFGTSGRVTVDFAGSSDVAQAIVLQPDGKIVLSGWRFHATTSNDFALARFNADGSLDTSFNGTGTVNFDFGGSSLDQSYDVSLQSDGKFLVTGFTNVNGTTDIALARLNANGTLDTSFNGTGVVVTTAGLASDFGFDVRMQDDGKILLSGYGSTNSNDFAVIRYNVDGSLDTSFGTGGRATHNFGSFTDDRGARMVLQADGRIVLMGNTSLNGTSDLALVRFNANGTLDTTFNPSSTLGGSVNYTENAGGVVLDADVSIFDRELSITNNFNGATLTLSRSGGANSQDALAFTGTGATTSGSNVIVSGVTVGTFVFTGGQLEITFNANATQTRFDTVMRNIVYWNSSDAPPTSVVMNWTFNDGNTGAQGSGGALIATGSTTVNITAVNDAPLLDNSGIITLTSIAENDISNAGQTIASILASGGGAPITDPDGIGALQGIAITAANNSDGSWQYSIDNGSSWQNVGAVANNSALLLRDTDLVRFIPSQSTGTTADFTFRAWDQTSGSAGNKVSTAVNGGTSAFSAATETASIVVTDVNQSPDLDNSDNPSFGSVLEGATNPSGITVAALVVDGTITDSDGSPVEAIAITALNTSLGTWQYSLNGGSTWLTIEADAINSQTNELALLLGPTASIRLLPVGDLNGTLSDAITFRAWDMAEGTEGDYHVIENPGIGGSAFSFASETAEISVIAVNDAPTFNIGDGIVTSAFGSGSELGYGMSVQADGKILVAGQAHNGSNWDFGLIRYNTDGTLDTSFGTGGFVLTAIGAGDDLGRSVTVQADGKILVAGEINNGGNWDFALVRYNSDGTLDTSFGGGSGMLTTAVGTGEDRAQSVTLQADGKILVAGYSHIGGNYDFAMVRYNVDGTLDNSFASGGILTTAIGAGSDIGRSVTVQADGKILVAGQSHNGSNQDFALVRYNSNGSLDTSFSGDGIFTTAIGAGTDRAYAVTLQADGKILLAGDGHNGSNEDFALIRVNTDGTLDTSFGTGGILLTQVGAGSDIGRSVTVQADGKILVAGQSHNGSNNDFALVRYNIDGTLDTSFGVNGMVTTAIGPGTEVAQSVMVQIDGKIVVAGYSSNGSNNDFAIVRYNADGTFDTRFDSAFSSTLGGTVSYTENAAPVVLDADVQIFDAELSAADNFDGATITLVRNGGANSEDLFSASGLLGTLGQAGSLTYNGTAIGTVTTNSGGTLVLTFNSNATQALVNSTLQSIAYSNSSDNPPASVQIDWTFDDGNTGDQGSGGALTATGNTTVNITAVNDAPVLDNSGFMSLTTITEDDTNNSGNTIAQIFASAGGDRITDPDAGAVEGIAITMVSGTNGIWQYNTGSGWTDVGTVSTTSALLLRDTDSLRFVPNGINGDTGTVLFHVWDQTSGTFGTKVDVTVNGGSTAFSEQVEVAVITVTSVNDAPVLTANSFAISEGGILTLNTTHINATDVDSPVSSLVLTPSNVVGGRFNRTTNPGAAVTSFTLAEVTAGVIQFLHDGGDIIPSYDITVSDGAATTSPSASNITYTPVNDQPYLDANGIGPSTLVNTTTAGDQLAPSTVTLSGGSYVIAWQSGTDIFAQLFNANGTPVGTEFQLDDTAAASSVSLVSTHSGGFAAAWSNGTVVHVRAFDANGTPLTGSSTAITFVGGVSRTAPVLTQLTNGNFVLTYYGSPGLDANSGTVAAQILDSAFNKVGSELIIPDVEAGLQNDPFVRALSGGGFVVSFTDNAGRDGDGRGNYAQFYTADGTRVGGNILINQSTTGAQRSEWITELAGGNVLFTYRDSVADGSFFGVMGRIFDSSGNAVTNEFLVNQTTAGRQDHSTSVAFSDGSFAVLWNSFGANGDKDIFIRRFAADGTALSDEMLVNTVAAGSNQQERMTLVSGNRVAITWQDSDADGDGFGIYSRQLDFAPHHVSHTENSTGVVLHDGINLVDFDDTHLESAFVEISGGYVNGQDQLLFTNTANITGTWDSNTGRITLSGSATVAEYQAALRSITYHNSSDDPVTSNRTISWFVNDGESTSLQRISSVELVSVNDAPVKASIEGTSLAYTENDGAVAITSTIAISDLDDTHIESAVVAITGNYVNGQDLLSFTNQNGITGSWNAITGELTLTGSATLAQYQTALRSITYTNTSDNPSTATRTVSFTVNDGDVNSNTQTRDIAIIGDNDAPVLDLDADDSFGAAGADYQATFTERDAPISIVDADVSIIDLDSSAMSDMFVRYNPADVRDAGSEFLYIGGTRFALGETLGGTVVIGSSTFSVSSPDGDGFEISGSAPIADWEALLRSMSYENTSQNPTAGDRIFEIQVEDTGSTNRASNVAFSTISVVPVNDIPVLDLNSAADPLDLARDFSITFTEGDVPISLTSSNAGLLDYSEGDIRQLRIVFGGVPMTSDETITIASVAFDPTVDAFHTILIDGHWVDIEYELGAGGFYIMGPGTGELPATVYETVIRSMTYSNNSENPVAGERTFTFEVSDDAGGNFTAGATSTMTVVAVNDAPLAANIEGSAHAYTENTSAVPITSTLVLSDVDDLQLESAVVAITANYINGQDILEFTDQNGITGVWNAAAGTLTLTGSATVAQYEAALRSITYTNTSDNPSTAIRTVSFSVHDGDADSNTQTRDIAITAINNEQVLAVNAGSIVLENSTASVITKAMLETTDLDNTPDELIYTLTSNASQGTLRRSGIVLGVNDTFSQQDINDGLVTYDHGGSEGHLDSFSFSVDDGEGSASSGTFNVTITPVNDNSPVITSNGGGTTAGVTVAENTTLVTTVTATDADLPGDTLTFSISGGDDSGHFMIDSTTGELNFVAAADFENPTDNDLDGIYEVTVAVFDGMHTTVQTINVMVTDVNESAVGAINDTDADADFVLENVSVGTVVGVTAFADDADGTDTVSYSLDDNAGGLFSIDSTSGVVTVAGSIDRESAASYNITVRATSTDTTTTTRVFTIAIGDVDEFDVSTPTDSDAAANAVDENVTTGTVVGLTANAFDLDATNNTITYSLTSNPDGLFQIDANTGVVTTASAIDRETHGAVRSITVQAQSSDGSTASQSFTIAINDLNEFDVTTPTDTDAATNEVNENVAIGTTVGITANAFDLDATTNTITYSLTSNPDGLFQIDANTGVVTTAAAIDREAHGANRSITVQASSSDGSTATQVFNIAINDLDEFDVTTPTDTDAATNEVNENVAIGTTVGITANAFDLDATNHTIVYTLDDNAGGRFAIDVITGVVTVQAALDYETNASHSISVRAISTDGSFSTEVFVIDVLDINEAPTATSGFYTTNTITTLQLQAPGLQVLASDPENDTLTVSLVTGPHQGTVTVSANGAFTYQPTPLFVGSTQFTVSFSDGQYAVSADITVVITAPNVPPPDFGGGDSSGGTGGSEPTTPGSDSDDLTSDDSSLSDFTVQDPAGPALVPAEEERSDRYLSDGESADESISASSLKGSGWMHQRLSVIPETIENFGWSSSDLSKKVPYFVFFARPSEVSDLPLLKDLQAFLTLFGELDRQYEEELKNHYFVEIDPMLAAAMGTGLLVWGLHVGNMITTLLTTSAAMSHVDPLVVLDGKRARNEIDKDWDEADILLDRSRPDSK